jgi:hypothetical protein
VKLNLRRIKARWKILIIFVRRLIPAVLLEEIRGVAQLVARYVRDVEAGSSSLLTPTKEKAWHESAGLCFSEALKACFHKLKKNKARNERSE